MARDSNQTANQSFNLGVNGLAIFYFFFGGGGVGGGFHDVGHMSFMSLFHFSISFT